MMEIDNDASLFGSHFEHHLSVLCDWVRWDYSNQITTDDVTVGAPRSHAFSRNESSAS